MSKSKSVKKSKPVSKTTNIDFNLPSDKFPNKTIIFALIILLTFGVGIYFVYTAYSANGFHSFPLDDPWIHLTFAKNIAEYHSFSYFKNELSTAGSTSPLYTIILAVGFIFTSNEMILSYALGIFFFVAGAISIYYLSRKEFGAHSILAIFVVLLFISDKWMSFISVSGMETTLYIFLLITAVYFYKQRNAVMTGVLLGLVLWARPDGVAFIGAIICDYGYRMYLNKKDSTVLLFNKSDFAKLGMAFAAIIFIYFGMNLYLSGTLLPNTYNAKLTYYSPEFRSRAEFLSFEVWDYFTSGGYSIIMVGFLVASLFIIKDLIQKRQNEYLVYFIFILALIFIYWIKLPYAHRFGRYLMPVIPFFILLSVYGFSKLAKLAAAKFNTKLFKPVTVLVILITIMIFISNSLTNSETFAYESKYIHDRHIVAAKWINENTNENDVIGTHDIGAIGFYSQRKIIDAAGLVTPELISKLHTPEYSETLKNYMKDNNVKYLAFLREWYRVVNQNPLFSTLEVSPVEVMEIFEFKPDSTLIIPNKNLQMIMYAEQMLGQRNPQVAVNVLERAKLDEPRSSLTYFLLAYAYSLLGNNEQFEVNLKQAVQIFPDYIEANIQLGNFYLMTGNKSEAEKYLKKVLETDPENSYAKELLNRAAVMETEFNDTESTENE